MTNDLALSQRLENLEHFLQANELAIKNRPVSLAPTELTVQPGSAASVEDHVRPISITYSETARGRTFESMLKSSHVYRRFQRHSERFSFHSSIAASHAWSALTDISLSDISHIAVLALPLVAADIGNAHRYAFEHSTAANYDNDEETSENFQDKATLDSAPFPFPRLEKPPGLYRSVSVSEISSAHRDQDGSSDTGDSYFHPDDDYDTFVPDKRRWAVLPLPRSTNPHASYPTYRSFSSPQLQRGISASQADVEVKQTCDLSLIVHGSRVAGVESFLARVMPLKDHF